MLTVVLFCVAGALCWWWRRRPANTTEPPWCPGAWPIVGHAPLLIGNSCKLWKVLNDVGEQSHSMGGVMSAWIGLQSMYVLTDPDDSMTVATTCLEKDSFYEFAKPWLGEGLITAKHSIWKNHRKLLFSAFNQTLLDTFMGVFNSQSRKLVMDLEKVAGKGLFDHWTYTRHNALETIFLTMLGVDFTDSNLNRKYVEALELILQTIVERISKFWWHSPYTFALSYLKKQQDACLEILHNVSNSILQKRKSELNGHICAERSMIPGTKFKAFMDLLLELSVEKGVFSDTEIREHVDTMIVAGHDTSANVLMFTIIMLGSYPEVQDKVYTEIQEVLGGDREVGKSDLSKLVYLEAVLKEVMRIFSIAPILGRKLDKDVKLKNYTLLAGRTCYLFAFSIHKHPVWGPDAHEFKPERWLEPGKLPHNAYYAFSAGKRQCMGKAYALMSMKTTLAHLVRRYRIKADHTKVRLKIDVMLKPDAGHHVSIEKRI